MSIYDTEEPLKYKKQNKEVTASTTKRQTRGRKRQLGHRIHTIQPR